MTFPSPDASGEAVQLHKVNGTYQRAKGSTNPDEARAIIAFICKRLIEWLKRSEEERPTLGVITFNIQQQGLIPDLLDAERKANPAFEWFFSDDREEPLIVKNLENIQGDERDVMLFSINFGPDQAGKITMNFGAMNRDGGEKRLNVAVTRARAELHVFASISADQIDMSRTRARGVADLKAFLDFADRGAVALAAQDKGSVGPADSPFEEAVRDALAAKGWEVHSQIGVSGFRIDLGVRHPDHAGAWLAGLECDGARYHSSATARDRDRIRQAVLEGLGWTILRIWSTDWFRAPEATLRRIDERLTEVLAADRARRAERAATERDKEAPDDLTNDLADDMGPKPSQIAQIDGISRIAALQGIFDATLEDETRFIWTCGSVTDGFPFRGMNDRSLREISRAEIADLIHSNLSLLSSPEDPDLELARLAGIARLSKDAREYLAACRAWRSFSATPR